MHSVLLSKHWLPVCFISTIPLFFFSTQEPIEVTEASMRDHLSGNCMFAMNTVCSLTLIPNYFEILKILQIFTPHSTSEQHLDKPAIKVGKLGLVVPTLMLKGRENSTAPSRLPSPTRHHGKRSSAARSFPNHQKYNSASMRPRACTTS